MLVDPISVVIIFKSLFYYDVATCEFKSKRMMEGIAEGWFASNFMELFIYRSSFGGSKPQSGYFLTRVSEAAR